MASLRIWGLLFQIDPRTFQAVFDQAKAAFDKAARDKERYIPLAATAAISKQELDQAVSAYDQTKAQLEQARLSLEFTRITSPIDGVAGLAQAQVGDLVGPNSGVLTSVVQVNPIKVSFSISDQQYLEHIKTAASQAERTRRLDELRFELVLADGSTFAQKGHYYSSDNQVDPNTGTGKVTLTFDNPGDALRPGQFGRVRLWSVEKGALVVPQAAVMEVQGARQVAVVDSSNVVHIRPVRVDGASGDLAVITQGLKAGERVVVEGLLKAQDGAKVNVQAPAVAVSSAPAA